MIEDDTLAGRTALVTGSAVRIGACIARHLHAHGANLLLHFHRSEDAVRALRSDLEKQRPGSTELLQADLCDVNATTELATRALAFNGTLDLLVNNASSYFSTPVANATPAQWDDLFGSNARGPFFLTQALAPALRLRRGAVVNIVDIHAERPRAGYCLYNMAKAANAMMVKTLARELAPEIRVNGVAPGAVLWPEGAEADPLHARTLERIPLGRQGTPDDVAEAVLYLCRAEYVTGQIVRVDGGRSVQQ